ncbi:MAG TPA: flagellar type III secretion system pore protein FliP [Candidatus Binatia bacterium]|nr:flagellar type III secretion system pore protein FliP [Candidatus Binatia bacterium]
MGFLHKMLEAMSGRERRLKLCETISLGDRRFLALVQFEQQQYLVGSTSQAITLIARVASSNRGAAQGEGGERGSSSAVTFSGSPVESAGSRVPESRAWKRACGCVLLCALVLAAATPAAAAGPSRAGTLVPLPGLPPAANSQAISIALLLTALTLLPALLLSMTPFVRVLVIFHFLRQALGTQTAPTNQTLVGLALFLTYFIMQPVGAQIVSSAVVPYEHSEISAMEALDRGANPLREFMLRYAREKDLALFVELSHAPRPREPKDLPLRVVAPAYILSELKAGFQIGAVLFLPFLVVDMAVAAITTSVGMLQLPPVIISTPLKILLFVVADGWNLVVGSLMKSFN